MQPTRHQRRLPRDRRPGALLASAACAGGPQVATGPQSNPSGARGLLAAASTQGPVPLVIDDVPADFPGGAPQIAGTASNAVSWLGASFAPDGRPRHRTSGGSCSASTTRSATRPPPAPASRDRGAGLRRAAAAVRRVLRRHAAGGRRHRHRQRQRPGRGRPAGRRGHRPAVPGQQHHRLLQRGPGRLARRRRRQRRLATGGLGAGLFF